MILNGNSIGVSPRVSGRRRWNPTQLYGSSLRHLLDPAASNVSVSSNLVSQLNDTSGLNRHLTAAGSLRPQYVAADQDFKNQPVLKFTGSQYLDSGVWASEPHPRTVCMVVASDDFSSTSWWTDGPVTTMAPIIRFGGLNYFIGPGGTLDGLYGGLQGGHSSAKDGVITVSQDVHIIHAFFNGATLSTFTVDGVLRATGNGGTAAITGLRLGARTDASLKAVGRVAYYYAVNRALTAAELARDVSALRSRFIPGTIMHYGDSITAGSNGVTAGQEISTLLRAGGRITAPYRARNFGVSSAYAGGSPVALFDLTANSAAVIDRLYHPLAPFNIAIWWAGVNDIYGNAVISPRTAAAIYADLVTFANIRASVGIKTIALTTMVTNGTAPQNTIRLALNALIVSNPSGGAYTLYNVAAEPLLSDFNNTTYFNADKLHLTDAGDLVVANGLAPIVNRLI